MSNNIETGKISWEISANADSAKKSIKGLSSEVKGLNKVFNLFKPVAFIAGLKKIGTTLGNLVMKEAEFIQTQNLFNKVMGESISKATEFRNRMESELGFDPAQIMKSMSAFKQLTDGFGLANDEAYLMSKNLTQLAADLTAYGFSFDNAMQKLKSGLSGEIEPMRAIGVALDKNTLQQTAYALGIDRTIDSMTRAQKTELLYYQIMSSTSKMQGELGRTMLSPANAARIMKQEFTQLARAVGSIFIPIMMKIIPVVRAVVEILTDAAKAIAKFFGFDIGDFTYSMSDVSVSLGDISGGLDDVAGSAGKATKEMQKMLMPFDELNNINLPTGSSGGSGIGGGIGGGGSLGIPLPEYDIFKSITGNMNKEVDKWKAKIEELIPVFKAVGIAAAGIWAFAEIMKFIMWIDKVKQALDSLGVIGNLVKTGLGILFTIGGVWAQYQGTKKLLNDDFSIWSLLEALGGTALGTFGIATILKNTMLGKALNVSHPVLLGLGIMLEIQALQVMAEGIKNDDIIQKLFGALEFGGAGALIAGGFGVGGKASLKIGIALSLVVLTVETLMDSIVNDNWLERILASLGAGAIAWKITPGGLGTKAVVGTITTVLSIGVTTVLDKIGAGDWFKDLVGGDTEEEAWEEPRESKRPSKEEMKELLGIDVYDELLEDMKQKMAHLEGGGLFNAIRMGIDKTSDSYMNLKTYLDELSTSYENAKTSILNNKDATLESITAAEAYTSQLGGLIDSNGKVKLGSEEMASVLINELNQALGTEYELTGNVIKIKGQEITSYDELKKQVYELTEAKKKEIEQAANQELFLEAIKVRQDAEKKYNDSVIEQSELRQKLNEAVAKGDKETAKQLSQDLYEAGLKVDEFGKLYQQSSSDVAYYGTLAFGTISEDLLDMSDVNSKSLQSLLKGNYEKWDEAYGKLDESQKETMLMMSTTIENWTPELQAKWEELAAGGSEKFNTAYAEIKKQTEKTNAETADIISKGQMPKQAANLATSTSSEFKKKLTIQDFIKPQVDIHSLIDTEKKSVITSVQGLTNDVKSNLNVDMGGYGVGSNLVKGIAQGINAEKKGTFLLTSMTGLAGTIGSKIKSLLGIRSPSRVMRDEVGKFIPLGIAEGIDMEASSVSDSMKELSERIKVDSEGFNSYLNPSFNPNINSEFTSKMQMDNDMAQGFEEATYNAMTKAISESMNDQELSPHFNVYVGNDKLYSGYGKQQNRESNMYGVRV